MVRNCSRWNVKYAMAQRIQAAFRGYTTRKHLNPGRNRLESDAAWVIQNAYLDQHLMFI